jgi:hypothetical protein
METPPPPPSQQPNESSSISADAIISKIKGITEKINALKVNMQQRIQTMQTQLEASTADSDEESTRLQGEIIKLSQGLEKTIQEKSELKAELAKLEAINSELTTLEDKVKDLIKSSAVSDSDQQGGYQYKSKSKNKTRSKRIIKLNKFGLLKSRSKTNKKSKKMKKKPLKSKLKRRVKGKSVKKGGAKKKKSHNKTKKHLKSNKSRRHK